MFLHFLSGFTKRGWGKFESKVNNAEFVLNQIEEKIHLYTICEVKLSLKCY